MNNRQNGIEAVPTVEIIGKQRGFSDFVVYVDESGDHSLVSIDKDYPVFVLAFCVFYKSHYLNKVVPELQQLKFDYFGHDLVILHEHEIRKEKGDFTLFKNRQEKNQFLGRLSTIIDGSNFILASCVIDKQKMHIKDDNLNPYHIALRHCLETLYELVSEKDQQNLEPVWKFRYLASRRTIRRIMAI